MADRRKVTYGPFKPEKLLAKIKAAGYWLADEDKPDFKALFWAFVETNGKDRAVDIRTLSNWVSATEPNASNLGALANALKCKPEDFLEQL